MTDSKKNNEIKKALLEKCVIEIAEGRINNENEMMKIVRRYCSLYSLTCLDAKKSNLMLAYDNLINQGKIKKNSSIIKLLTKRRVRTQSGVSVVSVMTKPMSCPGKCIYCPSQKNMPKSYLDNQPAAMRGVMFDFDPFEQVYARLDMLQRMGHDISKNEVIVLGGTFSAHPVRYQELFIKRIFDAFNIFNDKRKISENLVEAKMINESAKCRIIGLTVETRPDYITPKETKWLRYLGVTRVELGVQSVDDVILNLTKRGHNSEKTKKATYLIRMAGFKIVYHMMPGLPGSDMEKDKNVFRQLFSDQGYFPDHLKIYPTVVLKDSELFEWWKNGKYFPYDNEEVVELLSEIKKEIPPWVRIVRVMRDIPKESVVAGAKNSNIRQIIAEKGIYCSCIRCREPRGQFIKKVKKIVRNYDVLGGKEYFISYESEDESIILALLRLFVPKKKENPVWNEIPEIANSAMVRELHTYGRVVGIGEKDNASQHRGLGKKLMTEAELIAKDNNFNKVVVIAGVGVRQYYQKLGYKLEGEYMAKYLV